MVFSLSELELLLGSSGLEPDRARAVSLLASSSVFVGVVVPDVGGDEPSLPVEKVDGSILPTKLHLFLLGVAGESVVSLGLRFSVSSLVVNAPKDDWRL